MLTYLRGNAALSPCCVLMDFDWCDFLIHSEPACSFVSEIFRCILHDWICRRLVTLVLPMLLDGPNFRPLLILGNFSGHFLFMLGLFFTQICSHLFSSVLICVLLSSSMLSGNSTLLQADFIVILVGRSFVVPVHLILHCLR